MKNNDQEESLPLDEQLRAKADLKLADVAQIHGRPHPQHYDEPLQELRVHQIELAIQDEELHRSQVVIESMCAHFIELYDFAPIGYLTLYGDGIIAEINLTGAKLLGIERSKLINRRFTRFIADKDKDTWLRLCLLAKQHNGKKSCDLTMLRADGKPLHVHLDCIYKYTQDATPLMRVTLNDVTTQIQCDETQRIAAVAFETQDAIIVTDANKVILRVNHAFTRITGYSAEEAVNENPSFLCSGMHEERFHQSIWVAVMNDGYWQGELWEKRKNSEVFPVWLTLTAVYNTDGCISHYVASFTDITAQKQAEKILLDARQRLENQVTTTKEELEKVKKETAEINSALNILLKHRESDKTEAQIALSREVEEMILPFLKRLKSASNGRLQSTQLISILETNLSQLVGTYGRESGLSATHTKLTPVESQVASMIRQGLSTKAIATTLNISQGTVSIHRKHIRKKLGLDSKTSNLHSHLKALAD
jgi:PAS domain S-box-containing protein